jgi:hypothetical protein
MFPSSSPSSLISYSLQAAQLRNKQNAGEAKKDKATLESDASHATAKVGNYSASSSGAITKDDPNRHEGSWNQTIGSAKSAVGGLVGSEVRSPPSVHLPLHSLAISNHFDFQHEVTC